MICSQFYVLPKSLRTKLILICILFSAIHVLLLSKEISQLDSNLAYEIEFLACFFLNKERITDKNKDRDRYIIDLYLT